MWRGFSGLKPIKPLEHCWFALKKASEVLPLFFWKLILPLCQPMALSVLRGQGVSLVGFVSLLAIKPLLVRA